MPRFWTIACSLALAMPALPLFAQTPAAPTPAVDANPWSDDLKGAWKGTIDAGGVKLGFLLKVQSATEATLAIAEQGLPDTKLSDVSIGTASARFLLKLPQMPKGAAPSFNLKPSADHTTLEGTMTQGGMPFPAKATKLAEGEDGGPKRPQTPKAPFPYTTREVSFESFDGAAMNGTLTLPPVAHSGQPYPGLPCVLFITGSGIQDRDETIFAHKPFAVIADALARQGIASLRVDDRGWNGAKNPLGNDATTETYTKDALAAVDFMLKQPELDPKRLGLIGHSEGGAIAPAVAARMPESKPLAFIVLMAGPGVPGYDVLTEQMAASLRTQTPRPSEEAIAAIVVQQKAALDAAIAGDATKLHDSVATMVKLQEAAGGAAKPSSPEALEATTQSGIKMLISPWMMHFITRDPRPDLAKVPHSTAVLALNGGMDFQVAPAQNLPALTAALLQGGHRNVTARVIPGLNHLFQPVPIGGNGGIGEYGQIETTIDPATLDDMVRWIAGVVGQGAPAAK